MKAVKINFTIPEHLVSALKERVEERRRSAFVSEAISEKLKQLEEEQRRKDLVEGYAERREEDSETNAEWEGATLDGWK